MAGDPRGLRGPAALEPRPLPTLKLEPHPRDREPDEALLQRALRHAQEHLNEPADEGQRRAARDELRAWLAGQPHLNARTGTYVGGPSPGNGRVDLAALSE